MRSLLIAFLVAGCAAASEHAQPSPSVMLAGPAIVRNSPEAGADSQVAAYVRLRNTSSAADRLVALSCACAADVQIHSTFDRAMHVLPYLDIPAGGQIEIYPGGPTHLMLMSLRAPINPSETVRIRMEFERATPIELNFVAVENSRDGWAARDGR